MVDPFRATVQVGGPPVAQAGEPATSVVPVGAASVTVVGSVVAAVPVFLTVIV